MTLPPGTNGARVCRCRLAIADRWVSIAVSLRPHQPGKPLLSWADGVVFDLAGADELAATYRRVNWQGGVLSGARHAFRALNTPPQVVRVHELSGRLGSGDIEALSAATANAVATLLRGGDHLLDLPGWVCETTVVLPQAVASSEAVP